MKTTALDAVLAALLLAAAGCQRSAPADAAKPTPPRAGADIPQAPAPQKKEWNPRAEPGLAAWPAFPFEARARRELPVVVDPDEPEEGTTWEPAGAVLHVTGPFEKGEWDEKEAAYVMVELDAQSRAFALVADLEPQADAPSLEEVGALLFRDAPAAEQAWCRRHTRRILLPHPDATGASLVAFSSSADAACLGFLAVLGTRDGRLQVLRATRRGPIQSVVLRQAEGGTLLDITESRVPEPRRTGLRRAFLELGHPALAERLGVDLALDEVGPTAQRSVSSTVVLAEVGGGLEIHVDRTERSLALQGGGELGRRQTRQAWLYRGGELKPLAPGAPSPMRKATGAAGR